MISNIPSGLAAAPVNLELAERPLAQSRRALYLCALAQLQLGQFQQLGRVLQELSFLSCRHLDGQNFYATKRLRLLANLDAPRNDHAKETDPRFPLTPDTRLQFDLLCAVEEISESRWDNARLILLSVCEDVRSRAGINEYTASASLWLATACRQEYLRLRRVPSDAKEMQRLCTTWQRAMEESRTACEMVPSEITHYAREAAWFGMLLGDASQSAAVGAQIEQGAMSAQEQGQIRQEFQSLADWRSMIDEFHLPIPEMNQGWMERWCCLARQFAPMKQVVPSVDLQLDWLQSELEDLKNIAIPSCIPNRPIPVAAIQ